MRWLREWFGRIRSIAPLGPRGERAAAEFLEKLGYRIIERGRRFRFGEIDLVAIDGETIVFVEVKTRRRDDRGDPAEAVDRRKQERLTRSALAYLKRRRLLGRRTRFDVVSIVWRDDAAPPRISHIRGAFEAAGPRGMYS
jgi:putative endonuclease